MERLPVEKIQPAAASAEGDCLLGAIFDERRFVVYHDKCDSLVGGALQGWIGLDGGVGRECYGRLEKMVEIGICLKGGWLSVWLSAKAVVPTLLA